MKSPSDMVLPSLLLRSLFAKNKSAIRIFEVKAGAAIRSRSSEKNCKDQLKNSLVDIGLELLNNRSLCTRSSPRTKDVP
ncbi:hypothetical protein BDV06DRAFT_190997 [Aspergillus oleicola]